MKSLIKYIGVIVIMASAVAAEVNVSGYIQTRYTMYQDTLMVNNFTVPKIRLKFSGKVGDLFAFRVEPEMTTYKLKFGYIDIKPSPYLKFRLGQVCIPFGLEFWTHPTKVLTADLTKATALLWAGDGPINVFDKGMYIYGGMPYANYYLAILNGDASLDNRAIVGKLELKPIPMVYITGNYYTGKYVNVTTGAEEDRNWMDGALKLKFAGAELWGEYLDGKIGDLKRGGYYGLLAYTLKTPMMDLQPVVKYGFVDPDKDTDDDETTEIHIGANIYKGNLKTQLFYEIFKEAGTEVDNNKFVAQVQLVF